MCFAASDYGGSTRNSESSPARLHAQNLSQRRSVRLPSL